MSILPIRRPDPEPEEAPAAPAAAPVAGVTLAVLVGESDGRFRARLAGAEREVAVDASVDPELLREAIRSGARVVLDASGEGPPVVVGALATARALTIDRTGAVEAKLRRFALTASDEALLAAAGAFVRLKRDDVELYGKRVVSRARELVRVLGRMVKIN
jgi:uncharacterized membrane protein